MKRVLVANRGTIARRIIKTLSSLGIESVAVYHADEKDVSYVREANFSFDLGSGPLSENFLNIEKLIRVAIDSGCDAIHPGYGFLSENHLFAQACEENKIKFIGPSSAVIRLMGLKSKAKQVAREALVPVLEGESLNNLALPNPESISFPLLIKAVAGGGGKGLKIARDAQSFHLLIESARREALQYFGNDELMLEPYLENARHIEVQILGNEHGEIIHLFERECSLQRNHQKVIEEAPAPGISSELREKLHAAAVRFAAQLNYTGAGTVEFLVSGENFWFLEMNTRIQVEHAVTEMITGVDIVEEQINIANGKAFSKAIKQLSVKGHSIEARIYAEDPWNNFRPSAGKISFLKVPTNVRFDTYIEQNTPVTPHFDSLLGKLVVHGANRYEAIDLLSQKLSELVMLGITSNISYLQQIVQDKHYRKNNVSTVFLENQHPVFQGQDEKRLETIETYPIVAAFMYRHFTKNSEKGNLWERLGPDNLLRKLKIKIDEEEYTLSLLSSKGYNFEFECHNRRFEVNIVKLAENTLVLILNGALYTVFHAKSNKDDFEWYFYNGHVWKLQTESVLSMAHTNRLLDGKTEIIPANQVLSPLFGKILSIKVQPEDEVRKGDLLMTIESMKTENNILAPTEGRIEQIFVEEGHQVAENMRLILINTTV